MDSPQARQFIPVVAGTSVYVVDGKAVRSFDKTTGAPIWSQPLGDLTSNPLIIDSRLLVATESTTYALDPGSGRVLWRSEVGGSINATTTSIFVTGPTATIAALNPASGAIQWSMNVQGSGTRPGYASSMAVIDGAIYFVSEMGGALYSVDVTGGSVRWRQAAPFHKTWLAVGGRSGLVLAETQAEIPPGGTVDFSGGELVSISPALGDRLWVASIPVDGGDTFALSGDVAVISALNSGVYGVNVVDGTVIWQKKDLQPTGGVTAVSDVAYVHSVDLQGMAAGIAALNAQTGDLLWNLKRVEPLGSLGEDNSAPTPDDQALFTVSEFSDLEQYG